MLVVRKDSGTASLGRILANLQRSPELDNRVANRERETFEEGLQLLLGMAIRLAKSRSIGTFSFLMRRHHWL